MMTTVESVGKVSQPVQERVFFKGFLGSATVAQDWQTERISLALQVLSVASSMIDCVRQQPQVVELQMHPFD